MASNTEDPAGNGRVSAERPGMIHDRRVRPHGVLPRHVQMWVMVGVAVVILAIILLTGQSPSPSRPQSATRSAQPSLVPLDKVRSFAQELAAEAARQRNDVAPPVPGKGKSVSVGPTGTPDPLTDDARRRDYQSLFADSIALSHRPADRQPYGEAVQKARASAPPASASSRELATQGLADLRQLLTEIQAVSLGRGAVPPVSAVPASPPAVVSDAARGQADEREVVTPRPPKETGAIPAGGDRQRLLEGTVIEAVLLNRLDGTFAGPVDSLVTTPVYSHDRQVVVIPAGARVLGASSPVQSWGDSRLAVSFHRLVMPDGRTYSLDRFKGLDQIGDAGLADSVNRHYLQVFGASLAIGALSGLAQYGTRTSLETSSFGQEYRQAAGSSLAGSTSRVLDRYLNVLPTIRIREGYRLKIYLTNDLDLPVYAVTAAGGVR